MSRKRSQIWLYFEEVEPGKKAKCLICKKTYKLKNLEFQMLAAVYHKGDHGHYGYTLKWESRLFSGLNAAKITNYIKKLFK